MGYATTNNPCETFNSVLKRLDIADVTKLVQPVNSNQSILPGKNVKEAADTMWNNGEIEVSKTQDSRYLRVRHLISAHARTTSDIETFSEHFDEATIPSDFDASTIPINANGTIPDDWEGELIQQEANVCGVKIYQRTLDWSYGALIELEYPIKAG